MKLLILIAFVLLGAVASNAETWNGRVELTIGGAGCPALPYRAGNYPVVMSDQIEGNTWSAKFQSEFLQGTATGLTLGGNRHAAGSLTDGWNINLFPDPSGIRLKALLTTVKSCSVSAQGFLRRGNPNVNLAGFWGMKQPGKSGMEIFAMMIAPGDPGVWVADINVAQYRKQGQITELPHERIKGSFANGLYGKTGWKVTVVWLDEISRQMMVSVERPGYKEYLTLHYQGLGYL